MVYFLTALYYEAKDIIEHYNMKKVMEVTKFQVFKGENELLIISGTSGIKAVVAAAYLLTDFKYNEDDIFVNVGICGAFKDRASIGDVFLCNKLIDNFSKKAFYPDMLLKHPFKEGTLESFSEAVNSPCKQNNDTDIIDLEGAFVYEAVSMLLKPQNIYIIKIVSDILKPETVTPKYIENLMAEKMPKVYAWLEERIKLSFHDEEVMSIEEYKILKALSENMKLTSAMNIELNKLSRQYKIRNNHIIDLISEYINFKCKSKIEGKKAFGELKEKLMEL